MNIRMTLLILLCVNVSILYAQIGAKVQQKNQLTGIWQNNQYGYQMTLILNQDGSGEFDGEPFTFTFTESKLSMQSAGETVIYGYGMQGNTLMLSGGDLTEPITFNRQGSQDGIQPMDIITQPEPKQTNDKSMSAGSENELTGIWSGNDEIIEFKSNGECHYLGQVFPYQISSGYLTLITSQGNVSFQYTVRGDQLSLTGNNNTVTYTKGTAPVNKSQGPPATGNGQVAMELVGKWCYVDVNSYNQGASSTSECITLNADGTYIYYYESSRSVNTEDFAGGTSSQNEDRGTWYVQGDRIYANSQSKGPASYRLEKRNHPRNVNDPMIVLDGRAYVTAYNKPPWR